MISKELFSYLLLVFHIADSQLKAIIMIVSCITIYTAELSCIFDVDIQLIYVNRSRWKSLSSTSSHR